MKLRWIIAAAGLPACTSPPQVADSAEDAASDTAGEAESIDPLVPEWGIDEVQVALEDGLAMGLPEPLTVRRWLFDLIGVTDGSYASLSCPSTPAVVTETTVNTLWFGDCEEDGLALHGGWIYDEITDPETGVFQAQGLLSLTGTRPSGAGIAMGGNFFTRWSSDGETIESTLKLGGTYRDDEADGWLGAGMSSGVQLIGTLAGGAMLALLDGSLAIGDQTFLYFNDLSFDASTCASVPTGQLWIRDPSSLWIILDFGEECAPCATVSINGEVLGESCTAELLFETVADALRLEPDA